MLKKECLLVVLWMFVSVFLGCNSYAQKVSPDILCERAKEAQENGDLVRSLCLLCQAIGMEPDSGELKSKALAIELQLRHLVSKGKECKDTYLMKKLEEAEEELVALKKRMVTEKAEWYKFFQDKVEKLKLAYEDKIKALEDEYKLELQQRMSKADELVEQVKLDLEREKSDLRSKFEEQLEMLRKSLDEKNVALEQKDKKISYLSGAYARLKKELEKKYQQKYALRIKELKGKIDSLNLALSRKEKELEELNKKLNSIRSESEKYLDEISSLRSENDDLNSKIEETRHKAKMDLLSKEKEYQACLGEITDLRNKAKAIQKELEALRVRNKSLEQRLEVQKKKIEQQEQEIDKLSQKLKQKEIIVRNQNIEIEQLKDTLFSCRAQLGGISGHQKRSKTRRVNQQVKPREENRSGHQEGYFKNKKTKNRSVSQDGIRSKNDVNVVSADSDFDKAVAAIDSGNYSLANKLLEKILKEDPNNDVARNLLDSVKLLLEEDK